MKKLVINIPRRSDRREHFLETNSDHLSEFEWLEAIDGKELDNDSLLKNGIRTNVGFRDKFNNRKLTYGEIGCALSHVKAWEKIAQQDEPVLILEDDAIFLENYDEEYYDSLTKDYNLIYLDRNEQSPEDVTSIDDKLEVPVYPYNTTSYIVTPEAAKILVNTNYTQTLIPVDEYLPIMLQHLNACALKERSIIQASRSSLSTDVEPVSDQDWFIDFTVHPVTIGTDRKKHIDMMTTANMNGIYPKNLGNGVEWEGTDMSGLGGGHKVNLLKSYIQNLPDHDVVLFTDAYDVLYNADLETITRRYLDFKTKVLFAAEEECWPDQSLAKEFENYPRKSESDYTKYHYLNSGCFIGEVKELKRILNDASISNDDDDQLFYQKAFLSKDYDVSLDYECYVFQCNEKETWFNDYDQFYNPITNSTSCIYHGNGVEQAKEKHDELSVVVKNRSPLLYLPHYRGIDIISDDMFLIDFMTQQQCEDMIELADRNGQWGSLSYDKFPAQEIRLKELDLWDSMEKHWKENVNPLIEKYWRPMEMYGLRDAFVMRYSMDTQKKLNLHTDASLVTGSVKLNDDYVGADLVFPRQKISNKDIPVGRAIMFPGMVTHGHECTELISGVKYSLTMWSSRYHGDLV